MSIYHLPVWGLLKEFADGVLKEPSDRFSKQQAIQWFQEVYPNIRPGTVDANLSLMSTNRAGRLHHNPKPHHNVFYFLGNGIFRRYELENDPQPIMPEKRTLESYSQLLSDYLTFERELETLERLQYQWENALEHEKFDDNELFDKIGSLVDDMLDKIEESTNHCTYIYNSPHEEQCYSLFKVNSDEIIGYELPETSEEFLNYSIDYIGG